MMISTILVTDYRFVSHFLWWNIAPPRSVIRISDPSHLVLKTRKSADI